MRTPRSDVMTRDQLNHLLDAFATQAAMADFGDDMPASLARSIVNAPGASSWPIAGYTYLLVYMDQSDCTKAKKLVTFVRWALSDGSSFASELEYVPLPDSVRQLVLGTTDATRLVRRRSPAPMSSTTSWGVICATTAR